MHACVHVIACAHVAIDPRWCNARCLCTLQSTELDLLEREHVMAVMDVTDEEVARVNAEDPDLGEFASGNNACSAHVAPYGVRSHMEHA